MQTGREWRARWSLAARRGFTRRAARLSAADAACMHGGRRVPFEIAVKVLSFEVPPFFNIEH